jgi:hypothetical protein
MLGIRALRHMIRAKGVKSRRYKAFSFLGLPPGCSGVDTAH